MENNNTLNISLEALNTKKTTIALEGTFPAVVTHYEAIAEVTNKTTGDIIRGAYYEVQLAIKITNEDAANSKVGKAKGVKATTRAVRYKTKVNGINVDIVMDSLQAQLGKSFEALTLTELLELAKQHPVQVKFLLDEQNRQQMYWRT